METARIEKRAGVRATSDQLWALIGDLSAWSRWNAYETDLQGSIGFGAPLTLTEALPGHPERRVAAQVAEWQPLAQLVWVEKRGWLFNVTRYVEIEELEAGSCIVATGAIFSGLRGELFHDKHKAAIRTAYEDMVEKLRLAAEG